MTRIATMSEVDAVARMLDRATHQTWWPLALAFLDAIEHEPALAGAFARLPAIEPSQHLNVGARECRSLLEWGQRALQTLISARSKREAVEVALLKRAIGQSFPDWAVLLPSLNQTYVEPVVFWAHHHAGALPMLHHAVDRWIQRLEWFDRPDNREELDRIDERRLQVEFFKHLFDDGFTLADTSREAMTAHGRVDFILRTGQVVPVELKVWSGPTKPVRWVSQATDYANDLQSEAACLVIVSVSSTHRLLPDADVGTEFRAFGKRIHLRIADIGGGPSSKDADKRKLHRLRLSDLLPPP